MSLLYPFVGLIGLLIVLFVWAIRSSHGRTPRSFDQNILDGVGRNHISHWPQVRQALDKTDCAFVASRAPQRVLWQMKRERRRVVLAYLLALRGEFEGLLRTARVIALLSPEVAAVQELERLRLTIRFFSRYRFVQMSVWSGYVSLPQMDGLSNIISGFSVRVEAAIKELGERAALVAEMVSAPDRRRIYPA